ncbi:MAG: GtrA family protein [Gammaproteobacteria bacterium]|nr:GtrA family protein [Gammaproteobacteria bacterium]
MIKPFLINKDSKGGELLRFGLVGVVNTLVDLALFLLFYLGFGLAPLLANALAFAVAVSNSYLLNQRWTFRSGSTPLSLRGYATFVLLNSGGLLLGSLALLLLVRYMPVELAKLCATGLTLAWNFSLSRRFVFRPGHP